MISKAKQFASQAMFSLVHKNNLIYNTCWEDPRIDREAMNLGQDDDILMITSAGCNALDYALDEPNHIYCVDMNPKQNALLALKIAGIKKLEYEDFFAMFGEGRLLNFFKIYGEKLRPELDEYARKYWDKRLHIFDPERGRKNFYHCGTSGFFAQLIRRYCDFRKIREGMYDLFECKDLAEQRKKYLDHTRDIFWSGFLKRVIRTDATLALLGVPRPQRQLIDQHYTGGIVKFMEDCVEYVFTQLPLHENYFWWLYFHGSYTMDRCPEYLKEDSFHKLKAGLTDKISLHTSTILDFLKSHDKPISKLVLLDHMDWLSAHRKDILAQQWQEIVNHSAAPGEKPTQVLWRSGGPKVDFVDPIQVRAGASASRPQTQLGELLQYDKKLAERLHLRDRVHTYGSFYIADLNRAA